MALLEAVKLVPCYSSFAASLWGRKPKIVFATDSQPLLGWLRTGWVKTDPALQGVLDLVLERVREIDSEVLWVSTSDQRADRHTKFIRV
jgi:hypothetical protein